jgi:hypothetical protein
MSIAAAAKTLSYMIVFLILELLRRMLEFGEEEYRQGMGEVFCLEIMA